MSVSETARDLHSARTLTLVAYASFLPIGVVTVLLGPMLPTLSARWSLNYSQAGALFNAQYLASTVCTLVSGVLVARWGFRFAMKSGLLLATAGLVLLLAGSKLLGIICIAAYGGGLGLAVPAANLMVAEVNPGRRGATLNLLNFCWSAGAVSCPFLVAIATRKHQIPILLGLVAACLLLVLVGIAFLPASVVEPTVSRDASGKKSLGINWRHHSLPALATLFFVYVGVENGFGGWVATYSKSLGRMTPTMSLMTPSFFYAALTLGRWLAPLFLRWMNDARLVQAGLVIACVGMSGLLLSHALPGVIASACLAGLGLSSVYPITISFLSREFGPAASRIGSVLFMLSNLGGGLFPWIVGVLSSHFGTLKAGLGVPLIGSAAMYILYLRDWQAESTETA
ncbi:MAG TPA: MFS transporter [Candidatus Sulfotelmatobacter sp.]|nr:MFS transporter [Candidatus Sulfotelmatobacter sp.]